MKQQGSGWQPLKGLKVIDFSMLLPGPLTTLILADLGAEIIKIEPPGGDYARHMKGHIFAGANRNKSSIVIDMKSPSSAQVVEKLAKYGDVAIEGFRPGVADKLGFGAEQLQAINPRLIYCSLSGFGQTGPASKKAGHDLAYIAMGGGLANKGQMRQPPSRSPLPIADIAGGSFAAVAILSALRDVDRGGKAAVLDLSLYEAVLYSTVIRFGFGTSPDSIEHLYPANDLFLCKDGRMLALTVIETKFWENLVTVSQPWCPELGEDRFATEEGRLEHAADLMDHLDKMLIQQNAEDWVSLFDDHDVPATVCVTAQEAIGTDHATVRKLHIDTPEGAVMPFPVIANGTPVSRDQRHAPELGAQGNQILQKIGFTANEITELTDTDTVMLPEGA